MNEIKDFIQLDYHALFLSLFTLLAGILSLLSLLEKIADRIGLEFKWMRRKREEHELLLATTKQLSSLAHQHDADVSDSIRQDQAIRDDLAKLTAMFVEKEIDDMRWEIINFAARISDGRSLSKDSYQHCFNIYEKYEKILNEHGMTNGEVDISMEIIREAFKMKLKNGEIAQFINLR